jgi:outer membrane protein OmpA-like peptidoglycan-associated protein
MKFMLNTACCTVAASLILLTGCVSSRKYKASQADVAKLKGDSTQLAQQVSSLNGNVQDLQNKNTTLQRSLDSSGSSYATQQKHLDYYQSYFKQQQDAMSQVSDNVKGALTQAGVANADVEQVNNVVYVRLDENELFRKNSTTMSPAGKKVLDTLAQIIAGKSNVNVFVATGDSAVAGTNTIAMDNSAMPPAPRPIHHRPHPVNHTAANSTAQTSGTQSGSTAANTPSGTAPVHKVHHHYSAEGSTAFNNGPGHHSHAWALKQGRMVAVANHFLKGGTPKINVSLQQPPADGTQPSNVIKVIFTPKMEDFNPQSSYSTR